MGKLREAVTNVIIAHCDIFSLAEEEIRAQTHYFTITVIANVEILVSEFVGREVNSKQVGIFFNVKQTHCTIHGLQGNAGLSYNINVGIYYLGAWLVGNGCAPNQLKGRGHKG